MPGGGARLAALIFDLDGTLAETEEVHRAAFNETFEGAGIAVEWSVGRYRELLATTGGKRRILRDFAERGAAIDDAAATALHLAKNGRYAQLLTNNVELRPGVDALISTAKGKGLATAIATTTSRANVDAFIESVGLPDFDVIVCAEDVTTLKPDPEAYLLALRRLALSPSEALAFEDSENGLQAAVGAGLRTIVTPGLYTSGGTFAGASEILPDLTAFDLDAY